MVACEQAVLAARAGAALIARSGLIVGGGDPSDRFGYWPGRFAQAAQDGGAVLVLDPEDPPLHAPTLSTVLHAASEGA